MKCPKCGEAGAYEPLMRSVECSSPSCELYVEPEKNKAEVEVFVNKIKQTELYLSNVTYDFPAGRIFGDKIDTTPIYFDYIKKPKLQIESVATKGYVTKDGKEFSTLEIKLWGRFADKDKMNEAKEYLENLFG